MGDAASDISEAVVLYLGFGSTSTPGRNRHKLAQRFGVSKGALLESEVASLLDELGRININWSTQSLEAAGEMVYADMHLHHPELTETALRALRWEFTWNWR